LFFSEKKWKNYEQQMCGEADKVIVVVEEAKVRLESLGIDESKIVIVSNTQDLEVMSSIPEMKRSSTDWPVLFYGGGINEHRGLQYVIRALPLLKNRFPDIMLKIVGDGSYSENLKSLATQCNVEKQVDFTGYKPFREMLGILSQTDVALIPHVKSGHTDNTIPHKIFQYMNYGIPMMVSNCKPLERIINETGAGMVYEHDSPESFAQKLQMMMDEYQYWKTKSNNSREFVLSKYNWEVDSGHLTHLYNDLLKS
jgi:glycosyltransferase involved in cell wall biosynthesis